MNTDVVQTDVTVVDNKSGLIDLQEINAFLQTKRLKQPLDDARRRATSGIRLIMPAQNERLRFCDKLVEQISDTPEDEALGTKTAR